MRLLVTTLLLATALAGCAQEGVEPTTSAVSAFEYESASYDVQTGNHTSVGNATITLTIEDDLVRIEGTFSPHDGSPSRVEAVADARTGERLYQDGNATNWFSGTEGPMKRWYFWGASMVFPADPFAAGAGVELAISAAEQAPKLLEMMFPDLLALVGPQWTLLRGASHETIHGVDIQVETTSQGHRVLATTPCPDQCPTNLAGLELVQDWLLRDGLLPVEIHHHDGDEDGVRFVRTDHEARNPVRLDVTVPVMRATPDTTPLCNRLPCESENWRQDISPSRIRAAIEDSQEWKSWRQEHPKAVLTSIAAGAGDIYSIRDIGLVSGQAGYASYAEDQQGTYSFGVWGPSMTGPLPRSTMDERPWHRSERMPAVPEAAMTLAVAAGHAADLFGADLTDLGALSVSYLPAEAHPDPRAQTWLYLVFDRDGDSRTTETIHLSLTDGTVFSATHNLPVLPEDPNR